MYKIIIEKVTKEVKRVTEWERLHDKDAFDSKEDPQFGYRSIEKEVEREATIYTQSTEKDIDIKQVIDAFNQ